MAHNMFQNISPQMPDGSIINLMGINYKIFDPHAHEKLDPEEDGYEEDAHEMNMQIPAVTYENGVETRTLVLTDCAHLCPIDPTRSLYHPRQGLYIGVSHTGRHYCHLHAARCQKCGVTLCTQGDSDAFKVMSDGGGRPQYFCYDHYEEIKSENMKRSLLRGFFGKNSGW